MSGVLVTPLTYKLVVKPRPSFKIVASVGGGGGGGSGTLTEVQAAGAGLDVTDGTGPIVTLELDFGSGAGQVPTTAAVAAAQADATTALADAAAAQSDVDAHEADTSNPHAVTKAQVGLANVTNDPQWASALSSQISALAAKTSPVAADVIAVEDSAASFAKKKVALSDLKTFVNTFDPTVDINPRHYWRASNTVQSGGLVDTITDFGRVGGKNFTQTGAARCPTGTDGNGKTYLAPDGAADTYKAGTAGSDWTWLNNGTPWTIAFVADQTTAMAFTGYLLGTYDGSGANAGFLLQIQVTGAGGFWGPRALVYRSGVGIAVDVGVRPLDGTASNRHLVVITHYGDPLQAVGAPGGLVASGTLDRATVHLDGTRWGFMAPSATAYSMLAPTGTGLYLFSHSGPGGYSNIKLYELWIDDRAVPQRLIDAYAAWAKANYATSS